MLNQGDNMPVKEINKRQSHIADVARVLKAMANEHRLLIISILTNGEMSVGRLNEKVPLSQSSLSQHLGRLRESGLVNIRRGGKSIYYSLRGEETAQVIALLNHT